MIAVRLPMPPINGMGSRNPNSARLGIVCATLANPSTARCSAGRRVMNERCGNSDQAGSGDGDGDQPEVLQCQSYPLHARALGSFSSARLARNAAASGIDASRNSDRRARSRPAARCRTSPMRVPTISLPNVMRDKERRLREVAAQSDEQCCNSSRVIGSSAPNGSSNSRIGGSPASARATPTRCRCPPESSRGRRSPNSAAGTPTRDSRFSTRPRTSSSGCLSNRGTNATFRSTFQCGNRPTS